MRQIKGGKIDKEGMYIYVHALPNGIYNVRATAASGSIYQEKLIVKRN